MRYRTARQLVFASLLTCFTVAHAAETDEWRPVSPRDEVKPLFAFDPQGGPTAKGAYVIEADQRPGLMGWWERSYAVEGGETYRFEVMRRTTDIATPRRTAVVRILWRDDAGNPILRDKPSHASYRKGERPRAEPEFVPDFKEHANGWTQVGGIYRAPSEASRAIIELGYRWAPAGRVEWANVELVKTKPLPTRKVRLATIHHRPAGGETSHDKCAQFAPLIAEAAAKQADLVVLPETLTYYGRRASYVDCAEPIPGPSTKYFGQLAKKHDLYIVAGLLERDKHLVYNVAVLIGPEGEVVGKYRKVTLPRGEIEGGITPGNEYPVFKTRFGTVGMMICYDGFFPEVARELSNRGAEVIAWPVWGCNPLLAEARACENHVYVVSSTYTDVDRDWILSAIYGHDGTALVHARDWGSVVVTEVDLNEPTYWHSLGDFKAQIQHHRPE